MRQSLIGLLWTSALSEPGLIAQIWAEERLPSSDRHRAWQVY